MGVYEDETGQRWLVGHDATFEKGRLLMPGVSGDPIVTKSFGNSKLRLVWLTEMNQADAIEQKLIESSFLNKDQLEDIMTIVRSELDA